ncbi:MAG: sigma-70 family RNA polymerase sigma factor [candidate division Zixibacteria bacterium]|nr:sigma-70 family RNA polymerase sigma factor [candidate division Zixibacteria bacterium]
MAHHEHISGAADLQALLVGLLNGDQPVSRLIRSHIARYTRYHLSVKDADHEDVVAEVQKILLENLRDGQFHGKSIRALNAYIYGITRRQVARVIDRRALHSRVTTSLRANAQASAFEQHDPVAANDLVSKIYARITAKCKELLRFKFERGFSDQEIADQTGMTKNAVSTAISRCLKKIRELPLVAEFMQENREQMNSEE